MKSPCAAGHPPLRPAESSRLRYPGLSKERPGDPESGASRMVLSKGIYDDLRTHLARVCVVVR